MRRGDATRLALLASIWGCSFLLIKIGLEGLSPMQVVAGRLLFGALTLAIAIRFGVSRYPSGWFEWRVVGTLGVISNVIPFALFAWGEQRTSSGLASVLNATTPLWTAALVALGVSHEHLGPRRLAGLLAGLAGVVVIARPWRGESNQIVGELACFAAAACYGLAVVYTARRVSGSIPPITAAVGQVTAGAVLSTVIAVGVVVGGGPAPHADAHVVLAIGALGVFGTGLAYLLFFTLIEQAGPTAASSVTYAVPVVGVLMGYLVLDEHVGWNLALGGALVLIGIVAAQRRGGTTSTQDLRVGDATA